MTQVDMRIAKLLRFGRTRTKVGPDAIDYQFTVDDPHIFTRPWTAAMPMTRGGPIFEYACHEGNYSIRNMLTGHGRRSRVAESVSAADAATADT